MQQFERVLDADVWVHGERRVQVQRTHAQVPPPAQKRHGNNQRVYDANFCIAYGDVLVLTLECAFASGSLRVQDTHLHQFIIIVMLNKSRNQLRVKAELTCTKSRRNRIATQRANAFNQQRKGR